VEPVEEEGVKGGCAGGAFAWREAEESGKTRKPGGSGMLSERLEAGAVGLFSSGLGHRYDHTRPTGDQPWLLPPLDIRSRHGCSPALLPDYQDYQFARDDRNLLSISFFLENVSSIDFMNSTY
jgi:hypothetical protein